MLGRHSGSKKKEAHYADEDGMTALHYAALLGAESLAELLIWSRTTAAPASQGFKEALAALGPYMSGSDRPGS